MLLWLSAVAMAGSVYVNGTYVEPRALAGVTLSGATVRFDDQGNMRIDAPGYKIQLATPSPDPQPTGRPPTIAPPAASQVTYGRWWLITEDKGSVGHVIDVYINNQLATTFRSGKSSELVEISKWLHLGSNVILLRSTSTNASGGSFTVYGGSGSNDKGALNMPNPSIEFGLSSSRTGAYQREYTLSVDR